MRAVAVTVGFRFLPMVSAAAAAGAAVAVNLRTRAAGRHCAARVGRIVLASCDLMPLDQPARLARLIGELTRQLDTSTP